MQKKSTATSSLNLVERVRRSLGRTASAWRPRFYLNTGSPELNAVIGHPELGVTYGKILEVSGKPSTGKSVLALDLAALSQEDGAHVVWVDAENSFDQPEEEADTQNWYQSRGLKCHRGATNFSLVQPYVGQFGDEKEKRLITAQELLEEAEKVLGLLHQAKCTKIFLVLDSVTALLPEGEASAGLTNQNMRTNMSLPEFLGHLLRRWIGLCQSYNCFAIFVNQLRTKPGFSFGDPDYTPGGNAIPFYAHVRVRMRRVKDGRMTKANKVVGIKGILRNAKNKAGGVEGTECGYKIFFDGRSRFVSAAELKEE